MPVFFSGDPHMVQGDGEVTLTAMEGSLRPTFRLTPVWLDTDRALARLRAVAGSTWRRSPRDLLVLEHLVAEES